MNTNNLQADAMTLAAARVTSALKSEWRASGRRDRDFVTGEHRRAISDRLANDPSIVRKAEDDLRRWILAGVFGKRRRSQFATFVQKPRR